MTRKPLPEIEIWCNKHWRMGMDTHVTDDPANMLAANEFLLRRFIEDTQKQPAYKNAIAEGMPPSVELNRALANLAPICCLYKDDILNLLRACTRRRLAITHPDMNAAEQQMIVEGRLESARMRGLRDDN